MFQELKTGWVSSSNVNTSVNQPTTLLAVPPMMTQQPSNAVPTVPLQIKTTSTIVTPPVNNPAVKLDTSSKFRDLRGEIEKYIYNCT